MKKLAILFMLAMIAISANAEIRITGIMDGTLSGGNPKAIELYVSGTENLADYTIEREANGGSLWSTLSALSGEYTDTFVYLVGTDNDGVNQFNLVFGTTGIFANRIEMSVNGNGNDAFRLKKGGLVVDQYGDPSDISGSSDYSAAWCYLDSYSYRVDETGPDGLPFTIVNWTVAGNNTLDGLGASQIAAAVPFGTYVPGEDPNTVDPNIPSVEYTYDWEDGGFVLGGYGNVYKPENTTEEVNSGSRSLKVSHRPISTGSTAKPFLGWVKNLKPGDRVDVELYAHDTTVDGVDPDVDYHRARIRADYSSSQDITDFFGWVTGGSEETTGIGWEKLTATFYHEEGIDGDPNAMIITAYLKVNFDNEVEDFYFDDLTIWAPEHAEVVLPSLYDPNDYTEHTYGWQDFDPNDPQLRETVLLGTFYSIQTGLEYDPTNTTTHSGHLGMYISEDYPEEDGPTGQGYIAWVKGLKHGDYVNASCFGRSYAGAGNNAVRMWAHYTYDDNDIRSYAGSADGYDEYSDPNGWTEFQKLYIFSDDIYTDGEGNERTPTGLIIEARPYAEQGEGGYIDDISLVVPDTATVEFPSPTGDAICVGGLPEWDFNADCIFNLVDLVTVIDDWLGCNLQPEADCNL